MLGSKPSRDAGNPPVIMLAQAVRIERTWASFRATLGYQQPTPEEIWRAVKESNPAKVGFGDQPAPSAQPELADSRPLEGHTLADTNRLPTGLSALADLLSKSGGDSRSRTCTAREDHHRVQAE